MKLRKYRKKIKFFLIKFVYKRIHLYTTKYEFNVFILHNFLAITINKNNFIYFYKIVKKKKKKHF